MDKYGMRQWTADLEGIIDNKLKKWQKIPMMQNGKAVQLTWHFGQSWIMLNIFWEDGEERVDLAFLSPPMDYDYSFPRLTDLTFNRVSERIGNLAMLALHPPIEPPPPPAD